MSPVSDLWAGHSLSVDTSLRLEAGSISDLARRHRGAFIIFSAGRQVDPSP